VSEISLLNCVRKLILDLLGLSSNSKQLILSPPPPTSRITLSQLLKRKNGRATTENGKQQAAVDSGMDENVDANTSPLKKKLKEGVQMYEFSKSDCEVSDLQELRCRDLLELCSVGETSTATESGILSSDSINSESSTDDGFGTEHRHDINQDSFSSGSLQSTFFTTNDTPKEQSKSKTPATTSLLTCMMVDNNAHGLVEPRQELSSSQENSECIIGHQSNNETLEWKRLLNSIGVSLLQAKHDLENGNVYGALDCIASLSIIFDCTQEEF
jgi:hypothetical protein